MSGYRPPPLVREDAGVGCPPADCRGKSFRLWMARFRIRVGGRALTRPSQFGLTARSRLAPSSSTVMSSPADSPPPKY
jgi:hypothetical protein